MSIWDDAARAAGRYGDQAGEFIRRFLLQNAPPSSAPDTIDWMAGNHLNVSSADLASLTPAQRAVAAGVGAGVTLVPAAAMLESNTAPAPAAPTGPAVTPGGEAELAAEVPPLAVEPEPEVGKPAPSRKPTDLERLRARRNEYPMVLDQSLAQRMAADSLLADDQKARAAERAAYDKAGRDQDAARRQAELQKLEDEYNAERESYDRTGRPRLVTKPLADRAGGYTFRTRPDGSVEVVDNAQTEAESKADFRKWANETPGSARQRRYDPAGAAEWDAKISQTIGEQAREQLNNPQAKWEQQKAEDMTATSPGNWAIQRRRLARQAGVSPEKARELMGDVTRGAPFEQRQAARQGLADLAEAKENQRLAERDAYTRDAVVRRAQARQNPLEYLGRKDINDWQQYVMSRALLGGPITDPNAVDAAQMGNVTDVIKKFMVAGAGGALGADPAAQEMMRQKMRLGDPAGAGQTDISSGKYDTQQAQDEFKRLAESHDTTWTGFSYANEAALADALQKPPYNMPKAEAEAMAYRYAEKRRWVSGGGPGGRGAPSASGGPAPAAPTGPEAWGGGAPLR